MKSLILSQYLGHPVAIKAIDVSKRGKPGQLDSTNMVQSFQKEVKMAYKMRQETRHIVTIYGFDFDPRRGLALMAMELGGDTLQNRIEILHGMKDAAARHRHVFDRSASGSEDYISTIERKNIWFQLNNIVQTLHRYRVVRIFEIRDNFCHFYHIGSSRHETRKSRLFWSYYENC